MKKILVLLVNLILAAFLITGCGANNANSDQDVSKESAPETNYTENQTEMGNYMNTNYCYISDGWVYLLGWESSGYALFHKMREDQSDDIVLRHNEDPQFIAIDGEYIYAVLSNDGSKSNIYRYRLGGEDEKLLVENAYYLQLVDDSIYYCKENDDEETVSFCKSDLEGKNEVVILEKEVYDPYVVDNYVFYQDSNDGETIHRYDLSTKEDTKITQKNTHIYILNDDYMYCVLNDGSVDDGNDVGKLSKVDLYTLEATTLYDGASVYGFNAKDDRLYFMNTNDDNRIYSIDKNGNDIKIVTQDTYCGVPLIYNDKLVYLDQSSDYEYANDIVICNLLDGSDKKSLSN